MALFPAQSQNEKGEYISGSNSPTLTISDSTETTVDYFSATKDHNYIISINYSWTTSIADKLVVTKLLDDSNNVIMLKTTPDGLNGGGGECFSIIFKCTANTSVRLRVYQNSGSSRTIENFKFCAYRLD